VVAADSSGNSEAFFSREGIGIPFVKLPKALLVFAPNRVGIWRLRQLPFAQLLTLPVQRARPPLDFASAQRAAGPIRRQIGPDGKTPCRDRPGWQSPAAAWTRAPERKLFWQSGPTRIWARMRKLRKPLHHHRSHGASRRTSTGESMVCDSKQFAPVAATGSFVLTRKSSPAITR
jgi:hypothetical protein